jgi:MFS family permease
VGIAALARLLPGALAAPFGGLIGDRSSRRTVLVISALGNTALLGVAAAAAAADAPVVVVFVLAGLSTVAISPYVPADGALMPLVARTPQELSAANVAHSLLDNMGFLVAGIAGGVLLATASPQAVFGMAAIAGVITALLLARLTPDARPSYARETSGTILAETARGARSLLGDPRLRLVGTGLSLLMFVAGAADVLAVIVALDLLGIGQGAVGYLNAAWGIGALLSGGALAVLLNRGQLTVGLVLGCLMAGASLALPGLWVVAVAGYIAWVGIGFGYTFVEVAARTLLQRLGSDETLARALAFLETSRFAAMALGSIAVPALIALFGERGTLIAVGLILPAFALARWSALRALEIGAPVQEEHFRLLREHPIFAPLPIDTLERLSHDLLSVTSDPGEVVVTQGEPGERFYLIADGKVRVEVDGVARRTHAEGEGFGEIALLKDVPRTATVTALDRCRLLTLDRRHFISAVTGHRRSGEAAATVVEDRLA